MRDKTSDLGVVARDTAQRNDQDGAAVKEALTLSRGHVSPRPVTGLYGLHLVKTASTSSDHASGENEMYAKARQKLAEGLAVLCPGYIKHLRQTAKIIDYLQ